MTFKEKLKTWQTGLTGFNQWLADIQPRILTFNNRWELFKPTKDQKKLIKKMLATKRDGTPKHFIYLQVTPRRHSKSTLNALILLWHFTSRMNYRAHVLGSTEETARDVQFALLKGIINNTPKLRYMIPPDHQFAYSIEFPELQNSIRFSATNLATSFGAKLNCVWVGDYHAHVDTRPFEALQSSLADSRGSIILMDANVDPPGGPVDTLEKIAETDPLIFCHRIKYRDMAEFEKKAPPWYPRDKARLEEKTKLPAAFRRDVLGLRSDLKNALFPSEVIEAAKDSYRVPVQDIDALVQGRAYRVGGALDRSKSLLVTGRGDYTVWTCLAKVASASGGEPEYYILNQVRFQINTARSIKRVILDDHKRYGLHNVVLENFETADLFSWMGEEKIPCELISPSATVQNASFPEMHRLFKEKRFHFPKDLEVFVSELSTFAYTENKNSYSFGHVSEKFKDDSVYATNWAIFSLRKEVLTLFEMSDIVCDNRSRHRHLCFLLGGRLELHCKANCPAYQEAEQMWRQYRSFNPGSDITLPSFFESFVKVAGAVFYQSA